MLFTLKVSKKVSKLESIRATWKQIWKSPHYPGPRRDIDAEGLTHDWIRSKLLCRTQIGQRQTVKNEEYFCHAHNRDSLVGIAFADSEYPARAGFGVVNKVLDEYSEQSQNKWRSVKEDSQDAIPVLEPALQKYQVQISISF